MSDATKAIRFLKCLRVPEGKLAGRPLRLAPFQQAFIRGALAKGTEVAVLSVGRGNGKSALSAGLGLGALLGVWDDQPRREILIGARTRDQAQICWSYAAGLAATLPDEVRARLTFKKSPRLEIIFEDDSGVDHVLRAIAADGKGILGASPNLVIMDERGHWERDKGDALENALLSGIGKRAGRGVLISTSASEDSHPFSQWIDQPPPATYVQEHRPQPGLPADDVESLLLANPGARVGIGSSVQWLESAAARAIARGGNALASFRLYNRNERVSGETRTLLLAADVWQRCEAAVAPERAGPLVVGIDLGGSASMSAAALYWPETARLETYGWFPSLPSLLDRGASDNVGERYEDMHRRGELATLGERVVPGGDFIHAVLAKCGGYPIAAMAADRYRQSEVIDALAAASVGAPQRIIWRGQGWRDGSEDVERFRAACLAGRVLTTESLLMRSALADAICLSDPAGNAKLVKGRSMGRIDPAAASVLAVAEGVRQVARPAARSRVAWA